MDRLQICHYHKTNHVIRCNTKTLSYSLQHLIDKCPSSPSLWILALILEKADRDNKHRKYSVQLHSPIRISVTYIWERENRLYGRASTHIHTRTHIIQRHTIRGYIVVEILPVASVTHLALGRSVHAWRVTTSFLPLSLSLSSRVSPHLTIHIYTSTMRAQHVGITAEGVLVCKCCALQGEKERARKMTDGASPEN